MNNASLGWVSRYRIATPLRLKPLAHYDESYLRWLQEQERTVGVAMGLLYTLLLLPTVIWYLYRHLLLDPWFMAGYSVFLGAALAKFILTHAFRRLRWVLPLAVTGFLIQMWGICYLLAWTGGHNSVIAWLGLVFVVQATGYYQDKVLLTLVAMSGAVSYMCTEMVVFPHFAWLGQISFYTLLAAYTLTFINSLHILTTLWDSRTQLLATNAELDRTNRDLQQRTGELSRTSEQLQAANARLETEQRRLEGVVGGMRDAILLTDEHFQPVLLNPAARGLFGIEPGAVPAGDYRLALLLSQVRQCRQDTTLDLVLLKPERTVLNADVTLLRAPAQQLGGAIIALRNVSEQWERDRQRLEFQAMLANQMHERIRQCAPPNGRGKGSGQHREPPSRHLRELEFLIQNQLYFVEVESGPLRITRMPVSLESVVQEVVAQWRQEGQQWPLRLGGVGLPHGDIWVDPQRLGQALHLMLAVLARTSPTGHPLSLDITQVANCQRLRFTVAGRGAQLAPTRVRMVWSEHLSSRDRQALIFREELALTLAFIKHIAEAHGGEVQAGPDGDGLALSMLLQAS